jgi:RNA polymerase sigma factor (sigma-70 family)
VGGVGGTESAPVAQPSVDTPDPPPRDPSSVALRAFVAARRRNDRPAMSEAWRELLLAEWAGMQIMIAGKRHPDLPGGRVPREDRDEVAHQVWLRLHAWLKLEGSSIGEVRAIIRQAVHFAVLDHMRAYVDDDAHRAGSFDEDAAGDDASGFLRQVEEELATRLEDPLEASERSTAVGVALADLPEPRREVVVLRLCGYTSKEVAARLGLQPSNVDQIYSRGLKQLRVALKDAR